MQLKQITLKVLQILNKKMNDKNITGLVSILHPIQEQRKKSGFKRTSFRLQARQSLETTLINSCFDSFCIS